MASCTLFVCGNCHRSLEAWSDGNPYFIDELGAKQYAYHPDHEDLARCIGNDTPHLCLTCGSEFMVDSRAPVEACTECGAAEIVETIELIGKPCPWCKKGAFAPDPEFFCIS